MVCNHAALGPRLSPRSRTHAAKFNSDPDSSHRHARGAGEDADPLHALIRRPDNRSRTMFSGRAQFAREAGAWFHPRSMIPHKHGMKRRMFLSLLSGAAAAPFTCRAETAASVPLIGYLDGGGVPQWFEAFRRGLQEQGYVENRSIIIERRSQAGAIDRFPELAAELVRLKPQVIVASGSR